MDDLGEPIEASPEFFSCTAKAPATLTKAEVSENFVNLLACSSRFGYAVVATGVTLSVLKLSDIRDARSTSTDSDLSPQGIQTVLSIQFILGDTVLLVHAECDGAALLLLDFPALVSGNVQIIAAPVAAVTFSAFSEPNPTNTPSSQLIATLTSAVHIYNVSNSACEAKTKIDVPGPLSLAFSPSDEMLAIGTQRGCVYVYIVSDASLAATIVEVESGWIPFAIHFVKEDAVLVTYSKDDNVRYIMWTLDKNGKKVSIASYFQFGELCLPSPDVSSDQHPNVVVNSIPVWDMCIISSSISTEAEIVAKVENEWQVWKLDESKSVYLPINEDGDDTFPLGSAVDYNDVSPIEPEDPSSEMIQPMPRFLVLTSDFKLLPYSLTDSRAGANCSLVRPPNALPTAPSPRRPVEHVSFPDFSRGNESSAKTGVKSASSLSVASSFARNAEHSQLSATVEAPCSKSSNAFGFSQLSNDLKTIAHISAIDTKDSSEKETDWTESTNTSNASVSGQSPDLTGAGDLSLNQPLATTSEPKIRKEATNLEAEANRQSILVQDSSIENARDSATHQTSLEKVPVSHAFSGAGTFLSQFYSKGEAEDYQPGSSSTAMTAGALPIAKTRNLLSEQVGKPPKPEPKSVSLQPSLDRALITAGSGEAIDLIKSMLYEMSEELETNRKAGAVLTAELKSHSLAILSKLDTTRTALSEMMESTLDRFRREACLRDEVGKTLKDILRISRAYETLALELQVEDTAGLSRSLKPEDVAMDEQISSKETDVVKSIASIERRLAEEAAPQKYRNPAEVIREIYASLSLQGIRIRRVLELLKSLSGRLQEHDQGGRQSSLGLSLARLEQLNLEDGKSSMKSHDEQSFGFETPKTSTEMTGMVAPSSTTPEEGHELFPPKIDALLRKLAMSGGRELIRPLSQKFSTSSRGAQKGDTFSSHEDHRGPVSLPRDKAGDSQMVEVRDLLDGVNQSARPQLTSDTQASSTSSLRTSANRLPFQKSLIPSNTALSPNRKAGFEESNTSSFKVIESLPSSAEVVTQNKLNQKRKMGSSDIRREGQTESAVHGKETTFGFEENKPSNKYSAFGVSATRQFEANVSNSSPQKVNLLHNAKSRQESPFFSNALGRLSDRKPVQKSFTSSVNSSMPQLPSSDPGVSINAGSSENERTADSKPLGTHTKPTEDSPINPRKADQTKIPFAGLPPDDFDSTEKVSSTPFASLPPKSPFASLPPDDFDNAENDLKKTDVPLAKLPLEENGKSLKPDPLKSVVENKNPGSSLKEKNLKPTSDSAKRENVNIAFKDGSHHQSTPLAFDTPRTDSASILVSDSLQSNAIAGETRHSDRTSAFKSSSSMFGSMYSTASDSNALPSFGQVFNQQENRGDVFGTSALVQSSAGSSMSSSFQAQQSVANQEGVPIFGAEMQMNQTSDENKSGDSVSPIAATESDDSDDEYVRQGMDTSMGISNSSSQGFSNPSTTGGSLFGQAFSSAFGTPTSGAQIFGQSASHQGTQFGRPPFGATPSSFGTPNPNAMGGNTGRSSSSFGPNASFGTTLSTGAAPVFGAPSALGASPTFGNASPLGAQGSPFAMPTARFGETSFGSHAGQSSSMLGFGMSSTGTGGASPFGAVATGTGFAKSSGSASGFAALAASSNGLVFGNGGGPPAFTSAAFTERRA